MCYEKDKTMKIDLHVHTSEVSRCGKLSASEIAAIYKEKGYDAICITNHFSIPSAASMAKQGKFDFVKAFDEGFELAKKEGEKVGLRVFKGYELRCNEADNDFLVYHMPNYLLENYKQLLALPMRDFLTVLHQYGVKVYQAHPFRNGMRIGRPELLDGIEVYNAGNEAEWNESARLLAEEKGIACIAGSDGHKIGSAGRAGIATKERLVNNDDLVRVLKSREYKVFVNE